MLLLGRWEAVSCPLLPAPTHLLVIPTTAVTLCRLLFSGARSLKDNCLGVEVRKAREPQARSSHSSALTSHSSRTCCLAFSAPVAPWGDGKAILPCPGGLQRAGCLACKAGTTICTCFFHGDKKWHQTKRHKSTLDYDSWLII